ncbi:MAG: hypothetical protein EXS63_06940 [Candidatus Omnitrophica bacterium]|nr:hypothetical protein [Candidatus Omnitrophota bacterium]
MSIPKAGVSPEQVLAAIYGKSSLATGMSEKRRDEVIAAALFISFRNQEFGSRFMIPADFRDGNLKEDAAGIDLIVFDPQGRKKQLQIKGIHIQSSIERRKTHSTTGVARITSFKSQRFIKRDSEELTKIMKHELEKIVQDYSGISLIIYVSADLATQTSLEIAIRQSQSVVAHLKAKEVWFLRNIPVRMIHGKASNPNCHAYQLIKVAPDKHAYGFVFSL